LFSLVVWTTPSFTPPPLPLEWTAATSASSHLFSDSRGQEGRTVMQTISLEDAQSRLSEIIDQLHEGEEVVLTRHDLPVATLRAATPPSERKPRQLGTMSGTVLRIAPDFDDIPKGFEEYVE
jgi:antitoxin (DNA-binding transcriptional repressor) of toxin-antitoxin stability system